MSKMIVGKALKYNKEFIENKKKEIDFSIKYQILSMNTAFFAEILNDEENSKFTELIKINLNDYYIYNNLENYSLGGTMGIINEAMKASNSFGCDDILETTKIFGTENIEIKDHTNLIMNQDIIDGYWSENEETKKLIDIISQEFFNKTCNKVKILYKGNQENNIKYTILVIYYFTTKHSDKLDEYRLIINKAKKFLSSQGIEYEKFIEGI